MNNQDPNMRPNAVDYRLPTLTRRSFLLATGLAYASRFTSIAGSFLDWLTRVCLFDGGLRFAG